MESNIGMMSEEERRGIGEPMPISYSPTTTNIMIINLDCFLFYWRPVMRNFVLLACILLKDT